MASSAAPARAFFSRISASVSRRAYPRSSKDRGTTVAEGEVAIVIPPSEAGLETQPAAYRCRGPSMINSLIDFTGHGSGMAPEWSHFPQGQATVGGLNGVSSPTVGDRPVRSVFELGESYPDRKTIDRLPLADGPKSSPNEGTQRRCTGPEQRPDQHRRCAEAIARHRRHGARSQYANVVRSI
jgi:hypothetical protein